VFTKVQGGDGPWRNRCLITSFFTTNKALFLHCIIKLGNRNIGSKILKNMDIVSLITYLLDFLKKICCDSIASGVSFANTNNDEVAILEISNSCPLLESTCNIHLRSNHTFESDEIIITTHPTTLHYLKIRPSDMNSCTCQPTY